MSSAKEHRHIHGSSGLNFDLAEVRKRYATCVEFEHLPELQTAKEYCERILDEVEGGNYKRLYDAATAGVTLRDTEIDRLQRAIYNALPHDQAAAIIDEAPRALQRNVLRDDELVRLKQKLDDARSVRDKLIDQKQREYVLDWAYRITSAQGAVNQAKKALYIKLRKSGQETSRNRRRGHGSSGRVAATANIQRLVQ